MAWTELMEVEEAIAETAETTETDTKADMNEHCCKCLCEIKEILLRIESKMMAAGGESSGAEVIAYNERMR